MATDNSAQRAPDHSPRRNTTAEIVSATTQNWRTKIEVIFLSPGMALFYKSLAHAVDEIRVGRGQSRASHIRRDLPSMIGRVHNHVHQDVILAAAPCFPFT